MLRMKRVIETHNPRLAVDLMTSDLCFLGDAGDQN